MKLVDISTPKFPNTFAKVNDEDFERLNQWKWTAWSPHDKRARNKKIYACRDIMVNKKMIRLLMHRVIMNPSKKAVVDHINGIGLDNRKENLRVCTQQQNTFNSVKRGKLDKGVTFHKKAGKFMAQIMLDGNNHYLGLFPDAESASIAYNKAAKRMFGEFAFVEDADTGLGILLPNPDPMMARI